MKENKEAHELENRVINIPENANDNRVTIVVGHINPDTDSVCSAIAYADLKNRISKKRYVPMRAGEINSETEFVLKKFNIPFPEIITDIRTQVMDMEIRKVKGIGKDTSLKKAWTIMREKKFVTLPIVNLAGNILEGLITIGDIAKAYMDVHDSKIIAMARTPYQNVLESLEGDMVVGDIEETIHDGKVLIAAANPDLMESYIEKGDIVILGNRYESQLCAIEMGAQCIVVCDGAKVSYTITKLAESRGCTIIKTPYDTYTVARLINQSMPVGYFMSTENLVTFTREDFVDEIQQIMASLRHRDFPILDSSGNFCGMISRRNLLGARKKQVILVDHNEESQAVEGLGQAEIVEIIDHHRLGSLTTMSPVFFRNQPLGCTATIIYQMYRENNVEITRETAGLLCSAILSDTLIYRSPTCTIVDKMAAEELSKIAGINVESYAKEMFSAGSRLHSKTEEEIFFQDFKKFSAVNVNFGVGQINSMDRQELDSIEQRMENFMQEHYMEYGVEMVFFMMTDILNGSTKLLFCGQGAVEAVREAFRAEPEGNSVFLSGVVSRKKQVIPSLVNAITSQAEVKKI